MSHLRLTEEQVAAHKRMVANTRTVQPLGVNTGGRPKDIHTPLSVKRPKKAKLPPCPTEHAEQVAVIQWFDTYAPTKGLNPRLLFAIPNSSRLKDAGRLYKWREGLRSGIPDLLMAVPGMSLVKDSYGAMERPRGLFIEMKRLRGSVTSPEQLEMKALFEAQGYRCVIAKGADAAKQAIEEYLG